MLRLAALALLAAAPAAARTVDYAPLDAAGFAAQAARLKITPVSALPAADRPVTITVAAPDHEVLALGMYCAFKVDNPVSKLVKRLNAELAAAPVTAPATAPATTLPPLTINVTRTRSWFRCVELGELNVRCITKVTLAGEAQTPGAPARPVEVAVERDASVGGFCESLAQGVGVVTREAAHQLVQAALAP